MSTAREALESYLQAMVRMRESMYQPEGFTYLCGEEYVLVNGQQYTSAVLTEEEHEAVMMALERWGSAPVAKHCFHSAQMIVMNDHTGLLRYAEGWACGRAPIPIHHGWVVVGGKVVDLTWKKEDGGNIQGLFPKDWCYQAAEFSRDAIMERNLKRAATHSLLDEWEEGFPLLREPRPRSV